MTAYPKSLVIGHTAVFCPDRRDNHTGEVITPAGYVVNTHLLGVADGKVMHLCTRSSAVVPETVEQAGTTLRHIEEMTPVGSDIIIERAWPLRTPPPRHGHSTLFRVLGWYVSYIINEEDEDAENNYRYPPQVVPCLVGERLLPDGRLFNESIRLLPPGHEQAMLTDKDDVLLTIKDTYEQIKLDHPFLSEVHGRRYGKHWLIEKADEEQPAPLEAAG